LPWYWPKTSLWGLL